MTEDKRILIAEITTAHGIKGFVKVRSYAEDENLLEEPLADESGKVFSLRLKNALKGDWVAQIEGVNDRNAAETLRGTKLYINRAALPDTDEGEYYIEDLKGLRILDESGKEIGTLTGVENFGAGDLLDIKPMSGQSFYLPFTKDVQVDLKGRTITIQMPEIVE